jgi:hypothetical protein
MSTEAIVAAVVVVLALAAQSVRSLVAIPGSKERIGRLVVLVVAATLGALIVEQLVAPDYWAFGIALGLGMVELGPVVSGVVKRLVRRKGDYKVEKD